MNAKTTLFLVLLLGLFAGVAWYQLEQEKQSEMIERKLFEGLDINRIESIRVENLPRNVQLQLQRDPVEGWMLTDPIRYPADRATVVSLLENILSARGLAVPLSERGAKELGFTPPRAVLEVEQRSAEGELVTYKVEVGAEDLDRNLMNVRVDGVYLRALSSLYVPLSQNVDEFRSLHPLTISARSVVEVQRSGKVKYSVNDEPEDLELIAIRDGAQWYATAPVNTVLDSFPLGLLIGGATGMEVDAFVEDNCTNWVQYGLDEPVCRLEFKGGGKTEVLLLGRLGNATPWHLTREGTPYVWMISHLSALRLLMPAEGMLDLQFMRALRADVTQLSFRSQGNELQLSKGAQGWTVLAGAKAEDNGVAKPAVLQMADARMVEDCLAKLEDLAFEPALDLNLFGGVVQRPEFEAQGSIRLEVRGTTQGGEFGRVPGHAGLFFRRFGDELPLIAPDWFAELAQSEVGDFRSLELTRLTEGELAAIRFSSDAGEFHYERGSKGLWRLKGEEQEAQELLPMLDSMIYLKARDFPAAPVAVTGWVDVEFQTHAGEITRVRIEGDGEGHSLARIGDSQALLKRDDLYGALLKLWEQ